MSAAVSPGHGPARVLVAMYHGNGNVALITPSVAQVVARGHAVRVLAGPGVRPTRLPIDDRFLARIAATGATVVPFAQPAVHPLDGTPPRRGLVYSWTPAILKRTAVQTLSYRWSPAWAENMATELRREPADVVMADFVLIGALAAAEAAHVPAAAVVHVTYPFPAPGLPPSGDGFLPAPGLLRPLPDGLAESTFGPIP